MTVAALDILFQYAEDPDPTVRSHLAHALAATKDRDAARLLSKLATEDSDEFVNKSAIEELERLDPDMLAELNESLTDAFDPGMQKTQLANWFRAATLAAQSAQTSLFASLDSRGGHIRKARGLNRRLRWAREAGHSIWARMFFWAGWGGLLGAMLFFVFVIWLTIPTPDSELFMVSWVLSPFMALIAGLPLMAMFTPPSVPFKRSVACILDCLSILSLAAFYAVVVIWGLFGLVFDLPVEGEFFAAYLVFIVLPLLVVRLALTAPINIKRVWLRMSVSCLAAFGAGLVGYTLGLVIWSQIVENFRVSDDLLYGNAFIFFTFPLILMIGAHQGLRPDPIQSGYRRRTMRALTTLPWIGGSVLAVGFVILAMLPVEGPSRDIGRIALPAFQREGGEFGLANSETIKGHFRLLLDVPGDGELEITITGRYDGNVVDTVLFVGGRRHDDERRGPESYRNEKQSRGALTVRAERYQGTVDTDEILEYYAEQVQLNLASLTGIGTNGVRSVAEETEYEMSLRWQPSPERDEPATRSILK